MSSIAGDRREDIFLAEWDRERFLETFGQGVRQDRLAGVPVVWCRTAELKGASLRSRSGC